MQIIAVSGGVIVKRGVTAIEIGGPRAADLVNTLFNLAGQGEFTTASLIDAYAAPDRPALRDLIAQLRQRNIFVPSSGAERADDPLDVFYWHFDLDAERAEGLMNERRLAVAGTNHIARRLVESLNACGYTAVDLIDDPILRNPSVPPFGSAVPAADWCDAPSSVQCLVATSDNGTQHQLRGWNRFCVERQLEFFPVLLQDAVGYVGPLVIPGRTACLECLRARQNSTSDEVRAMREVETGESSTGSVPAFHPIAASMLGDIAAFELMRRAVRIPRFDIGTMIEVTLLSSSMTPRRILKIPRCAVCSALQQRSEVALTKSLFMVD